MKNVGNEVMATLPPSLTQPQWHFKRADLVAFLPWCCRLWFANRVALATRFLAQVLSSDPMPKTARRRRATNFITYSPSNFRLSMGHGTRLSFRGRSTASVRYRQRAEAMATSSEKTPGSFLPGVLFKFCQTSRIRSCAERGSWPKPCPGWHTARSRRSRPARPRSSYLLQRPACWSARRCTSLPS